MNTNQQQQQPVRPTYRITDLFTDHELRTAFTIIDHHKVATADVSLNSKLIEKVVKPALPRIAQVTGTPDNDPAYFAYLLQYASGLRAKNKR